MAQTYDCSSPNGRLTIELSTINDKGSESGQGQLAYSVTFNDQPLIDNSALSLEFQGQKPLGENVQIVHEEHTKLKDSYRLLAGKTSLVNSKCNVIKLHLQENAPPGRSLIIEARAYDDAVAFRYLVTENSESDFYRLTAENTEFRVSKDAITYAQLLPNFAHSYESEYIKIPISALSHQGSVVNDALIGLPLLMDVPGVAWVAINEANLRGYSSMYLTNLTQRWEGSWLKGVIAPQFEDTTVCVTGTFPFESPWRIIQVGADLADLMESNILTNLNEPSKIDDTSWIRPGKAAWNWWSGSIGPDGERNFSTAGMKYYIDFAATSGLEYLVVDAGWAVEGDITRMNGRVDIPELVRYGKERNVKIWIWIHYRDAKGQMEEAFPIYEDWGVAGLKIDFIERDDQKGIDFYYRAADLAANHHLMLDFHGSTKPTGLNRTYPNILGYEAVVGMEVSIGGLRDNPDSHVMIPFTRMLQGFMDYTPGGFRNVTKSEFIPQRVKPVVMGTRAHHLAMYVIYESPIQMVSDHPMAYQGDPSFQFIEDVPASWDETKVLNGNPGEYITMVRRSGSEWFLGSMTNWSSRQFEISLDFLGVGEYTAQIYCDMEDSGQNPRLISIKKHRVTSDQSFEIDMAEAGGCAIQFIPVEN